MQGINEIYAKNLILGHISKFKAVSDWKTIFKFCPKLKFALEDKFDFLV